MLSEADLSQFKILAHRRDTRLEFALRGVRRLVRAVAKEFRPPYRLPLKQRLYAWSKGFSAQSYVLYGLDEHPSDRYLSDLKVALKAYNINGYFNPIIGNKLMLSRLMKATGFAHPGVQFVVADGQIYLDGHDDPALSNEEKLSSALAKCPHLVLRPIWSGGGQGVFFLHQTSQGLSLNGVETTCQAAARLLGRQERYLATGFVTQAAYAQRIYPHATNTLRLLTLWHPRDKSPVDRSRCPSIWHVTVAAPR